MNTLLLTALALPALTQVAVCRIPCLPQMCDPSKCPTLTEENCAGKIVPNGGICHCCDGCYTILSEGTICVSPIHVIGGPPDMTECDDGLYCNHETSRCESKENA